MDAVDQQNVIFYQRQMCEGVPVVTRPTGADATVGPSGGATVTGTGSGASAAVVGNGSGASAGANGSGSVNGSGTGASAGATGSGSVNGPGTAASAAVTREVERARAHFERMVEGTVEHMEEEAPCEKNSNAIPLMMGGQAPRAAAPPQAKVKQTQPFVLVFCSPWWGGVS